jgi:cobalt-zinc-cadmium efflux system membrane fusion protein
LNPLTHSRKGNVLPVLGGILIGAIATAIVLSHRRTPPPPPAVHAETSPQARTPEATSSKIKLSDEAKETAGIHVEAARLTPMGESLSVPGTVAISPDRGAKITPPAAGKVVRLLVRLGDTVRSGQPLSVLDSFEVAQSQAALRQALSGVAQAHAVLVTVQAQTDQARAGVLEARAEVEQARTKQASAETALQRQRDLAAAGAFSQAPLQAAQSELSEAQFDLLKAQTDLQAHTVVLQRAKQTFELGVASRAQWEQAQLEQAQAITQSGRAKSRVEIAKQSFDREQKVFKGDLLSKQATQTAEAEVRADQGEVQKAKQGLFRAEQEVRKTETEVQAAHTAEQGAQATLAGSRVTLATLTGGSETSAGGQFTLRAPLDGAVTEIHATLGEAVERSTALFVIENLSMVLVSASVAEKDVARIRVGQRCEVTVPAYPGLTFPGVVQSVAGSIDEKTHSLPVRCHVQNIGLRLRPEMFAQVTLGVGMRQEALTVPVSALDDDGDAHYLYIEEEGGYERRKVELGRKSANRVEILTGLKPGEKAVTSGIFVLKSESKKGQLKGDGD